jgi:hypothetical protein
VLTLTFDPFGWATLEAQARAEGVSLGALLSSACTYFQLDLANRRPAARVPWFARKRGARRSEVALALAGETWKGLADEAHRQELSIERLIEHAALYYLADARPEPAALVRPIGRAVRPRDREA